MRLSPRRVFGQFQRSLLCHLAQRLDGPKPPPGTARRPLADMRAFLQDVCARGFQPNAVLDIGANAGRWSRMAKAVYPETPFVLVEPQVEMRDSLESFCHEFPDCRFVQTLLAAHAGQFTFTLWDDLEGSSALPLPEPDLLAAGRQRRLNATKLDDLLSSLNLQPPDLIKLDVQGFELEILKGAGSIWGRTELLILETSLYSFLSGNPLLHEVLSFMKEHNYLLYDIPGYLRRPADGALGQLDLAFARESGRLRCHNRWMV